MAYKCLTVHWIEWLCNGPRDCLIGWKTDWIANWTILLSFLTFRFSNVTRATTEKKEVKQNAKVAIAAFIATRWLFPFHFLATVYLFCYLFSMTKNWATECERAKETPRWQRQRIETSVRPSDKRFIRCSFSPFNFGHFPFRFACITPFNCIFIGNFLKHKIFIAFIWHRKNNRNDAMMLPLYMKRAFYSSDILGNAAFWSDK